MHFFGRPGAKPGRFFFAILDVKIVLFCAILRWKCEVRVLK